MFRFDSAKRKERTPPQSTWNFAQLCVELSTTNPDGRFFSLFPSPLFPSGFFRGLITHTHMFKELWKVEEEIYILYPTIGSFSLLLSPPVLFSIKCVRVSPRVPYLEKFKTFFFHWKNNFVRQPRRGHDIYPGGHFKN